MNCWLLLLLVEWLKAAPFVERLLLELVTSDVRRQHSIRRPGDGFQPRDVADIENVGEPTHNLRPPTYFVNDSLKEPILV